MRGYKEWCGITMLYDMNYRKHNVTTMTKENRHCARLFIVIFTRRYAPRSALLSPIFLDVLGKFPVASIPFAIIPCIVPPLPDVLALCWAMFCMLRFLANLRLVLWLVGKYIAPARLSSVIEWLLSLRLWNGHTHNSTCGRRS